MTNEALLDFLYMMPDIEEEYGTYNYFDYDWESDYKFYYNQNKTCICLDMGRTDLHLATLEEFRGQGLASELLEEYVFEEIKKDRTHQFITLKSQSLLFGLFLRNGFEFVKTRHNLEYTLKKELLQNPCEETEFSLDKETYNLIKKRADKGHHSLNYMFKFLIKKGLKYEGWTEE